MAPSSQNFVHSAIRAVSTPLGNKSRMLENQVPSKISPASILESPSSVEPGAVSFGSLLQGDVSYYALKRVLKVLRDTHPSYPHRIEKSPSIGNSSRRRSNHSKSSPPASIPQPALHPLPSLTSTIGKFQSMAKLSTACRKNIVLHSPTCRDQ